MLDNIHRIKERCGEIIDVQYITDHLNMIGALEYLEAQLGNKTIRAEVARILHSKDTTGQEVQLQ
jgi:Leu/Phe-tRNA-protein transferase